MTGDALEARTVVVDFNNIAIRAMRSIANAGCYRAVEDARRSIHELLGPALFSDIVYADPDVGWRYKEWDAYEKRELKAARDRGEFFIALRGTKADPLILDEAKQANGLIVSNDRYQDEISPGQHEWLLFEPHRLIAPLSVNGTYWTWQWIDPQEQIANFYGTLGRKGPQIDADYLQMVERDTGYNFRQPEWVEGEPFGIHHLARELGAKVTSVRWTLRYLGYSDCLDVALSDAAVDHVRKSIRK